MKMIPLAKQSKASRRSFYASQRGTWYGICPVTRTVPNKKAYDRNRMKKENRRIRDD